MRPFSSGLLDGPHRAAARAMLYPVGFTEADFKKPLIGIASTWSNVTPCNMHIDKLASANRRASALSYFGEIQQVFVSFTEVHHHKLVSVR